MCLQKKNRGGLIGGGYGNRRDDARNSTEKSSTVKTFKINSSYNGNSFLVCVKSKSSRLLNFNFQIQVSSIKAAGGKQGNQQTPIFTVTKE